MSGYVVFTREKTLDQGELDMYAGKPDNCRPTRGEDAAFCGTHEDLEGAPTEGTVILRTKLPSKNQRVDYPCLATSLVNDPSLRGEGREIHLTLIPRPSTMEIALSWMGFCGNRPDRLHEQHRGE